MAGAYEAFLSARNQAGQEQNQQLGMLSQLAQLQGVLSQQQEQQQLHAVLSSDLAPEAKQAALMRVPGGMGLLSQMYQVQEHQAKAQQLQREQAFRDPKNLAQFMDPGQTIQPATAVDDNGNPNPVAQMPGKLNAPRMLQGALSAGVVDPLAYAKEQITENKPQFAPSRSPGYFQNNQWVPTPENRAPEASSPVAKLLAEREAVAKTNPNDPRLKIYDAAILHQTNPQAQRIINMPQPLPVQMHTDNEGNLWERARGGNWTRAMAGDKQLTTRMPGNAEAKQLTAQQAMSAINEQITELQNHIKSSEGVVSGTVGVKGLVGRVSETGIGLIPGHEFDRTPALDAQSKKELIIGNIRSLLDSGHFSNEDKRRAEQAIGTSGLLTTPGNAVNSLENLRTFLKAKTPAKAPAAPSGTPSAEDFFRK